MIRLTFECPDTGEPLRTWIPFHESAGDPRASVSLHCPRCAQLHRFRRDEAALELGGDGARQPALASTRPY